MQVPPSDILKPFIRHYLFLEIKNTGSMRRLRFFPDGSCTLILTIEAILYRHTEETARALPQAFLYGAGTGYEDVTTEQAARVVAVVFHPDGIFRLLGVPGVQFNNTVLPLETVLGNRAEALHNRLQRSDTSLWPGILNRFLGGYAGSGEKDSMVAAALYHIHQNEGIISSQQLTRLLGYSERQIERKFLYETGITPSAYSGIIKVHTFLKYLYQYPGTSLTRLAYDARYADQSHLIKAFRKVTGLTPTEYLNAEDKLARNFIGSVAGTV